MNVDPPQFTNACDYHIPAPTGLSTYDQSRQARYIASCKACNTECALQSFDRASRAECLMSCDPSPMTPGATEQPGSVNYPDPIADLANDVREAYLPEMTALVCPEGVETNDGKFAKSIKCRPFTEALQEEAMAAAAASAQNACDAVRNQSGFRCDMADCQTLSDDDCRASRLCSYTPAEGSNPASCAWNTLSTASALNACMGNSNECKTGNSVFDGFNGLACETYGKALEDTSYNGKDYQKGQMRPFAGQYAVENGQFMCKKLGDGEEARTQTPALPGGAQWPTPVTEEAAQEAAQGGDAAAEQAAAQAAEQAAAQAAEQAAAQARAAQEAAAAQARAAQEAAAAQARAAQEAAAAQERADAAAQRASQEASAAAQREAAEQQAEAAAAARAARAADAAAARAADASAARAADAAAARAADAAAARAADAATRRPRPRAGVGLNRAPVDLTACDNGEAFC